MMYVEVDMGHVHKTFLINITLIFRSLFIQTQNVLNIRNHFIKTRSNQRLRVMQSSSSQQTQKILANVW